MEKFNINLDTWKGTWILPDNIDDTGVIAEVINKWFDQITEENITIDHYPKGNVLRILVALLSEYDIKRKF